MEIFSNRMEVGRMPHDLFVSWHNYWSDSIDYDEPQRNHLGRVKLPMIADR